jgi:hypothetical protein
VVLLRALKGGFFLRKNPLECEFPVCSNSENAVTDTASGKGETNCHG